MQFKTILHTIAISWKQIVRSDITKAKDNTKLQNKQMEFVKTHLMQIMCLTAKYEATEKRDGINWSNWKI